MTLNQLGFTKENGLVSCSHIEDALNNTERLYLHEVLKLQADAVFFRRFFNTSAETPKSSQQSAFSIEVNLSLILIKTLFCTLNYGAREGMRFM